MARATEKRTYPRPAPPQDEFDRQRAAFAHIAHHHRRSLLCSAQRLCGGNDDRAQDFVQDALLRAYAACLDGRFQSGGNPQAWLLRIVTNLFINDYRRRRKWEAGEALDAAILCAAPDQTPDALLLAATLDEPIERALNSLSDKTRQCVILVDIEGLDYAQAARSLGVPIGTVRSHLSRARRELQLLLRDYTHKETQPMTTATDTNHLGMKLEHIGAILLRYGLVVVLLWIGALKFTAYEAMGVKPLVSHSPFLSWGYHVTS
ncbi:MAG: DUF417 family protein, partial [Armatimonadota bacterium]|nr:DUF417 family protein [Armatimonadota bacterium]